jgi:nitrate reductase (NAD(P)H)
LLIKVYFPTTSFPAGGKMTLGFEELSVGDKIEFKGPLGSFEWLGESQLLDLVSLRWVVAHQIRSRTRLGGGKARWRGVERKPKQIGLICGGSGITPILQVLRGVIHDSTDSTTKLFLLNANKTESDILLRTELDALAALVGEHRYRQHLVLSQASPEWAFSRGRINRQMLQDHLPQPGDKDDLVLICGPDPMIQMAKEELTELGWDVPNQLVVF